MQKCLDFQKLHTIRGSHHCSAYHFCAWLYFIQFNYPLFQKRPTSPKSKLNYLNNSNFDSTFIFILSIGLTSHLPPFLSQMLVPSFQPLKKCHSWLLTYLTYILEKEIKILCENIPDDLPMLTCSTWIVLCCIPELNMVLAYTRKLKWRNQRGKENLKNWKLLLQRHPYTIVICVKETFEPKHKAKLI